MSILAHGDHPLTTAWDAIAHQFTGVDHLLTMAAAVALAVGAWSARTMVRRRRAEVDHSDER